MLPNAKWLRFVIAHAIICFECGEDERRRKMSMVTISDELVKRAVAANAIDENYDEEMLSKMLEDLLSEKIAKSVGLGMLKFRGSKVWEGNLDEMRRW